MARTFSNRTTLSLNRPATGFQRHVEDSMIGHFRRRPAAFATALTAFIIVILVAAPQAQQQAPAFTAAPGSSTGTGVDTAIPIDIDLLVGRSALLNVGSPIARVSLTVPDVADALVTAPGQLLIHGKQPGTISLFVWDKAGAIKTYEVTVRRDLSALSEQLRQLFPGEAITAAGSGKDVVLSGTVASKYVIEKAADVAAGYVEKKENVVNLLKQQEGVASNQVMLRVRFAEVSRSALTELGVSFVANGFKNDWVGRTTTQQFAAPAWDQDGKLVFSDFLNLFLFNTKEGLGGVVKALQTKGLFQSLAEPNLIATNGKEASFLAGGEYPYPIVQPSSGGNAVTVQFKEFGIRLNFTPTVLGGDLINLKVRPEVSALDFTNAVTLSGFRIPAISTRRTETEIELQDGQTFAIAGLMNNTVTSSMSKIPGIGDVPVLGLLFRSKAHQKNQTELVVMITPTIVRRGQPGVSTGLPSPVEPYLGRPEKTVANPDAYVGSPRYPVEKPATKPASDDAPTAPEAPAVSAPAAATAAPAAAPAKTAKNQAKQLAEAQRNQKAAEAEARERAAAEKRSADEAAAAERRSAEAQSAAAKQQEADHAAAAKKQADADAAAAKKQADEDAVAARRQAAIDAAAAKKQADEDAVAARNQAAIDAAAAKKEDASRRQAEKLAKERAAREAEVAKKNESKQAEEERKRDKAMGEAAARLKAAQSAYEEELQKSKPATAGSSKQ